MSVTKFCAAITCSLLLATPANAATANAACSPIQTMHYKLETLKANKWQLTDDALRQTTAIALLDCLAAPDPVLRDELAFEALSAWMRAKQLSPETLHRISSELQARLNASEPDAAGFLKPFAALTLAEVARADRVQKFLSDDELDQLIITGTKYLTNVRDYRGFSATEGWRHGVAHAADLMLQLALNPRLSKAQADRLLAAIASQVAPAGEHFYQYHEGERLMSPVFYIARKTLHDNADWDAWIASLMATQKAGEPTTQTSLARRHNLAGFLLPLYFSLQESTDAAQRARLLPAVTKALKAL